jgi:hypothetical protein
MTNTSSIYSAFNARWLTPEQVARTFVPTNNFKSLVKLQNSLLMGPRGCGKTTMLKMLSRPAQRVWRQDRVPANPSLSEYPSPDFEAVYIPSDIRWSYELSSLEAELRDEPGLAESIQRAAISISAIVEVTKLFELILREADLDPSTLATPFIAHFQLGPEVPTFPEVRLKLLSWSEAINSLIATRRTRDLRIYVNGLPHVLLGHSLDALIRACTLFDEYCATCSPPRWGLCFDELEIAPLWLQHELMRSLRSFDQRFLLKLTWSPILPADLLEHQERQHDYSAIKMWHSHAADARPFAAQFSTQLLQHLLNSQNVTPREVFGASPFAQDDRDDANIQAYAPGSIEWQAMISLARKDRSFREYLQEHNIDPNNPLGHSTKIHDEVLRKAKPVVLLRNHFLKDDDFGTLQRRSRKRPAPLYYGEDSIYNMSEGNPRLLAALLNELVDAGAGKFQEKKQISPEIQNRVLVSASYRTGAGIKTYPVGSTGKGFSLASLIDNLIEFLRSELVGRTFNGDPIGSFIVDNEVSSDLQGSISLGLLIGAFVYVGTSTSDVPSEVLGSRIRLTHMLVPSAGLVFRNYRSTRLSLALRVVSSGQRSLLWAE